MSANAELLDYACSQLRRYQRVDLAVTVVAGALGIAPADARELVQLAAKALGEQEAAAAPKVAKVEAKAPAVDLKAKIPQRQP